MDRRPLSANCVLRATSRIFLDRLLVSNVHRVSSALSKELLHASLVSMVDTLADLGMQPLNASFVLQDPSKIVLGSLRVGFVKKTCTNSNRVQHSAQHVKGHESQVAT